MNTNQPILDSIYNDQSLLTQEQSTTLKSYIAKRLPLDNLNSPNLTYTREQLNHLTRDLRYTEFLHIPELNQTISSSLIYPIRSSTHELNMIGIRAINYANNNLKHNKVTEPETTLPYYLYNIENIDFKNPYIIVTEGVFDALSIMTYFKNTIATLSATITKPTLHLLAFFDNIILALDNDNNGLEQTHKIIDFYQTHYPHINITTVTPSLEMKDFNQSLTDNHHNFHLIMGEIRDELSYFGISV